MKHIFSFILVCVFSFVYVINVGIFLKEMKVSLNINGTSFLLLKLRILNTVTSRRSGKAQTQDKLGRKEAKKKKITGSWGLVWVVSLEQRMYGTK